MMDDILNPRRGPRVQIRCDVELRHRLAVWSGETEDVSPGGCQVVTPRVVDPGCEVKVAIRSAGVSRTLIASGRVAWTRPNAPARLGIAFAAGTSRAWFDAVVGASAGALRLDAAPERLPRLTTVRLGRAPEHVVDFDATELGLLRQVGTGVTLDVLSNAHGGELPERVRGALFSLLARRSLVLDAGAAGSPEAWRPVLARRERDPQTPTPVPILGRRAFRTPEVQRLYDEALGLIGSGRLTLAMDRLRDALQHAPDDPLISSTAKRISRWA